MTGLEDETPQGSCLNAVSFPMLDCSILCPVTAAMRWRLEEYSENTQLYGNCFNTADVFSQQGTP